MIFFLTSLRTKQILYIFSILIFSASTPLIADTEILTNTHNDSSPEVRSDNDTVLLENKFDDVINLLPESEYTAQMEDDSESESVISASSKVIQDINITGLKHVSKELVMQYIPFKPGELFDYYKARQLVKNIYYELKRFRGIEIYGEDNPNGTITLHIMFKEKQPLESIQFHGNKEIATEKLIKELGLDKVAAVDQEELKLYAIAIERMYAEKNYHAARVATHLKANVDGSTVAVFDIKENKKSIVRRIKFEGNKSINDKDLRTLLFTKEDWLFGFIDRSGSYHPERIEADKHFIEQHYQNNGFLTAKVFDVSIAVDEQSKNRTYLDLTFHIQEGDKYAIGSVNAPGNEYMTEDQLKARLPVRPGDLYSRESIVESIKILELIWGEFGFINAHIEPSIQPHDETKTVDIAFYSETGGKVYLNRINFIGNKKTRDKVIRRKITLSEGDLLTNQRMEESKRRVEGLGYFEPRDGVNWKIVRLSENLADLDLMLKEARTGHAHLKVGFGGADNFKNPNTGLSIGGEVSDSNLFGTGINLSLNATAGRGERSLVFNLSNPWMFDKPIMGALDLYHRRPSYEDLKNTTPVNEIVTGGSFTTGFITPLLYDAQLLFRIGGDSIRYEKNPKTVISDTQKNEAAQEYQRILDKLFAPGDFCWISGHVMHDRRNHPMHPSRGHNALVTARFGLPSFASSIGFYKVEADGHWYTPLIGERDLVLHLHAFAGLVGSFKNSTIPYRELFHMGGPGSIRGYLFGQAGPKWQVDANSNKDPIGGKKGFFVNLELIFPIKQDLTMKGVFFYDGGAGWDNPYVDQIAKQRLADNSFLYRHAVGFGIRVLQPAPIKIDWGFKIDPRKRFRETSHEVHFSMSYDW